jgi:hypothetical protein
MLAFYCQQCGALDEKGARGHRCASTKTVASTVAITNAITNAEPAKLTPKQRAAAWNKANRDAYNARQRKLMKGRRAAAKAKRAAAK